jgi:hypothetical protein
MVALKENDLFSKTEISQKLGLKLNQFDYFVRSLKFEPFKRAGNKHAMTLWTQSQLEELGFALDLKESKHSFETIIKIIDLARSTNYQVDICAITIESTNEIIVCKLEELPNIVLDLANKSLKFFVETFLLTKQSDIDFLENAS